MTEPTQAPRPLRADGVFFLVLVQLAAQLGVILLGGLLTRGEGVGVLFVAVSVLVAPLVALYVGLVRYAPAERTWAALRLARPRGREVARVALALLVGVLLAPVAAQVTGVLIRRFPFAELPPEVREQIQSVSPAVMWGVLGAVRLVAAPIVEEALFRGLVLPRLAATSGRWRALGIVTLAFVVAQGDPRLMPATAAIAAAMGIAALAGTTTWGAIAGHLAFRWTPVVMLATGLPLPGAQAGTGLLPAWLVAACALGAGAGIVAIWRLRDRQGHMV